MPGAAAKGDALDNVENTQSHPATQPQPTVSKPQRESESETSVTGGKVQASTEPKIVISQDAGFNKAVHREEEKEKKENTITVDYDPARRHATKAEIEELNDQHADQVQEPSETQHVHDYSNENGRKGQEANVEGDTAKGKDEDTKAGASDVQSLPLTQKELEAANKIQAFFRNKKANAQAPEPTTGMRKIKAIDKDEALRIHEEFADVGYEDLLEEPDDPVLGPGPGSLSHAKGQSLRPREPDRAVESQPHNQPIEPPHSTVDDNPEDPQAQAEQELPQTQDIPKEPQRPEVRPQPPKKPQAPQERHEQTKKNIERKPQQQQQQQATSQGTGFEASCGTAESKHNQNSLNNSKYTGTRQPEGSSQLQAINRRPVVKRRIQQKGAMRTVEPRRVQGIDPPFPTLPIHDRSKTATHAEANALANQRTSPHVFYL
jgi:hypothetical protein